MKIQEAAKIAETFLAKFTVEKKHFRRTADDSRQFVHQCGTVAGV